MTARGYCSRRKLTAQKWNVPPVPSRGTLLPRTGQDRGYLTLYGYRPVDRPPGYRSDFGKPSPAPLLLTDTPL